jgi:hypothetical protein
MNAIAETARANALQVEAKKHALRQQQDGCWILTLKVHQHDMPQEIMTAAMGARYVMALVEIGDDEQPLPPHPAVAAPRPAHVPPAPPAGENKQKRPFESMAPSQQAGMLCQDLAFQRFLTEEYHDQWLGIGWEDSGHISPTVRAKVLVRKLCKVNSRSDIKPDNAEWSALVLAYRLWQRHPELSEA